VDCWQPGNRQLERRYNCSGPPGDWYCLAHVNNPPPLCTKDTSVAASLAVMFIHGASTTTSTSVKAAGVITSTGVSKLIEREMTPLGPKFAGFKSSLRTTVYAAPVVKLKWSAGR